jgi:preprotein translocase subunit SecY
LYTILGMTLALRLVAILPLPVVVPDAAAAVQASPFLALLDMLSGGATARGSAAALGLVPYALAIFLLRPVQDANPFRRVAMTGVLTATIAAAFAVVLWIHPQRSGVAPPDFASFVLTLTAGSFLPVVALFLCRILWPLCIGNPLALGGKGANPVDWSLGLPEKTPERIVKWIVIAFTVNLLATMPDYVAAGATQPRQIAWRGAVLLAGAVTVFVLSLGRRNVRVDDPRRNTQRSQSLPIAPYVLDVSPLLVLLVPMGAINCAALALTTSPIPWVATLARLEHELTDPGRWPFWAILVVSGAAVLALYRRIRSAAMLPDLLGPSAFVPGLRPAESIAYIRWISAIQMTAGALGQMLILAMPAAVAIALDDVGIWPLLLIPLVFVLHYFNRLFEMLRGAALARSYEGIVRRSRLRPRRGW